VRRIRLGRGGSDAVVGAVAGAPGER
jgi:hypothetical protein